MILGLCTEVTLVVPAGLVQPFTVVVTLYVPIIALVALVETVGFCMLDANESGPVQVYVAPETVGVDKLKVPPRQIGPLLLAVGVVVIVVVIAEMLLEKML